jgi:cell division protein FtsI (penicillin-binding protein 3)
LRKTYKALGIPHNNKQQSEWVVTQKQATKIELKPKKLGKNTVPNVVGMSAKDAVYLVESSGLVAHVMGYGKVKKQSIPAGKAIFHGGVIELVLE